MQQNLFTMDTDEKEFMKQKALSSIESIEAPKNDSVMAGIDKIKDLLLNNSVTSMQTSIDKEWIQSYESDNKEMHKGVNQAIKLISPFVPNEKSENSEVKLLHAIKSLEESVMQVAPLDPKEDKALKTIIKDLMEYKGDNLDVLADKLAIQSSTLNASGKENLSVITQYASNAVSNAEQIPLSTLDAAQIIALNKVDIYRDQPSPLPDQKTNTKKEPSERTDSSEILDKLSERSVNFESDDDSTNKFKQGLELVKNAFENTNKEPTIIILELTNQASKISDPDIKKGVIEGISIANDLIHDYRTDETLSVIKEIQSSLYERADKSPEILAEKIQEIAETLDNFKTNDLNSLASFIAKDSIATREQAQIEKDSYMSAEATAKSLVAREISSTISDLDFSQTLSM